MENDEDGGVDDKDAAEGPDESEEEAESGGEEGDQAHEHQTPASEFTLPAPDSKTDDLTDSLRKNREADLRKGKAVARQVVRTSLSTVVCGIIVDI